MRRRPQCERLGRNKMNQSRADKSLTVVMTSRFRDKVRGLGRGLGTRRLVSALLSGATAPPLAAPTPPPRRRVRPGGAPRHGADAPPAPRDRVGARGAAAAAAACCRASTTARSRVPAGRPRLPGTRGGAAARRRRRGPRRRRARRRPPVAARRAHPGMCRRDRRGSWRKGLAGPSTNHVLRAAAERQLLSGFTCATERLSVPQSLHQIDLCERTR